MSFEKGRVEFKSPDFFILETDERNFKAAAFYDPRLLRLYIENKIRKRMTTKKRKEPNRSDFSKTSFMIGFRMPFNSK
jgi:hypothetical protein